MGGSQLANLSQFRVFDMKGLVSYPFLVVMIAESTKQDKFLIKYVPIPIDTPSNGNFIELVLNS